MTVAVACLLALVILGSIQIAGADGFQGALCALTLGDHTTYAPAYTASGFERVQMGMTRRQVEQLLGNPLDEWTAPDDLDHLYRRWTRQGDGSDYYRLRVIRFLGDGVDEKTGYFYCEFLD